MSEQNYMSTRAANATIDELREELTAAQQRVVELEQSRDAWEKHYNARVPKLTAEVDRLRGE